MAEKWQKEKSTCNIFVKSFPGATVSYMEDYMKPPFRTLPDHFILHVETNECLSRNHLWSL